MPMGGQHCKSFGSIRRTGWVGAAVYDVRVTGTLKKRAVVDLVSVKYDVAKTPES
jgi:hypothetical protein